MSFTGEDSSCLGEHGMALVTNEAVVWSKKIEMKIMPGFRLGHGYWVTFLFRDKGIPSPTFLLYSVQGLLSLCE